MNSTQNPFAATGLEPHIADVGRRKTDFSFANEMSPAEDGNGYETTIALSHSELAGACGVRDIDQLSINGLTVTDVSSDVPNNPLTGYFTQNEQHDGEEIGKVPIKGIVQRAFHINKNGSTAGHFTTSGSNTFSQHIAIHETSASEEQPAPKSEDTHRRWLNYQNKGIDKIDHDCEPVHDPSAGAGAAPVAYLLPFRQGLVPHHDDSAIATAVMHNVDKPWLGGRYNKDKMNEENPETCLVKDPKSESGFKIAMAAPDYDTLHEEFGKFLRPQATGLNLVIKGAHPATVTGAMTVHTGDKMPNPEVTVDHIAKQFGISSERFKAAQKVETSKIAPAPTQISRESDILQQLKRRPQLLKK